MKNSTVLNFRNLGKRFLAPLLFFAALSPQSADAQNGSPCYKPIVGAGAVASPIGGAVVGVDFSSGNGPANLINGNLDDYAEISNLLALASSKGVSVKNNLAMYPAGWHAGYVLELGGSGLLSADVLNGLVIETDDSNPATPVETFTVANGLGITLLSGSAAGKIFVSFPTTKAFNEVRLYKQTLVNLSLATSLKIHYATAFDPNCGYNENNNICYDQLAGNGAYVNFSNGLLSVLSGLTNPLNIVDGNKNSYAEWTLTAGTGLLSSAPYVSVKTPQVIYPSGNKAGFIVEPGAAGLLTAGVLGSFSIQTYLHGIKQDDVPLTSGGSGLISANLLSGGSNPKQELAITTTKKFDEVRLVQTTGINASLLTAPLRVYYAFESGPACTDCKEDLISTQSSNLYKGRILYRMDGQTCGGLTFRSCDGTGNYGVSVGGGIQNEGNAVNSTTSDYASFDFPLLAVAGGAKLTVANAGTAANADTIPRYSFAGFAIEKVGGLINLGLLNAITIRTFNGTTLQEEKDAGSLLGVGLISGSSGKTYIGFKTTKPYNRIQIDIYAGVLNVDIGGTIRIYGAFAQRDDDNDGVSDCNEVCGLTGNDAIDTDGDGTPDACDACNTVNQKSSYLDTDSDGIKDACDTDSDNDGIPDAIEGINVDTDGDGVPNYLDLDSDNDGIPDLYESGLNVGSNDANKNGVLDTANPISTTTPKDTDGDGVPDYLDLDSDNDGITDLNESGLTGVVDANSDGVADAPDADNDGIQDSVDSNDAAFGSPQATNTGGKDTDKDTVPDFRDLDSDNDGISDLKESGVTGFVDANNNGVIDGPDADGDGIQDSVDTDDAVFGSPSSTAPKDTDADTKSDYVDLDSDNDSVSDLRESGLVGFTDADNDGVVDGPDSDGDGIQDSADSDDANFGSPGATGPKDTDNDGTPDYIDLDSDGDGINDVVENGNGAKDTNNDGKVDGPVDTLDDDGIPDAVDQKPNDFGGLGAGVDLFTIIEMLDNVFTAPAQVKNFKLRIANISVGTNTSGDIVIRLVKPNAYTAIALAGSSGTEWTLADLGPVITLTSKAGVSIPGGTLKDINLSITLGAGAGSAVNNMIALLPDLTGGDTNSNNNYYSILVNTSL